ncbi:hypothetical protein [Alloscardovia omnicolens]|uniref:hypothetical protein n=1 Tax=Alloscardovia omnicolens TaxID=419015 RepID=UPI003A652444
MVNKNAVAVDAIVATSTVEQISIADAQRSVKRSNPWKYVFVTLAIVLVLTVPYGIGRHITFTRTSEAIGFLSRVQPVGWALISWSITVSTLCSLLIAVIESKWRTWGMLAYILFAAEQFLSGMSILTTKYWWGTKVIFGSSSVYANGINSGIICVIVALGVFLAVYITTLIFIKKTSPLNIFTRSWAALSLFFVIELAALFVAMFGGLI